ncbi:hypothetical protein [Caulobacter soli]|uniref:hypothetical protein n=1 Tax=Caulobacter soli TaxID=2708539 RepID=UPI0013EAAE12|nr:hypothetical protein [Caulobacter soli]
MSNQPQWDQVFADALLGKRVIVGLTYVNDADEVTRLVQMHGVVGLADSASGVRLDLQGAKAGETYWLPPQIDNFQPAAPGIYRFRETGEEVVDPDFISTWTIHAPATANDPE